jgi:tRNA G10  N-methylase Trm11
MPYKFAIERPDYSNLASGKVFYSLPGYPGFPIRLASEIFQRCLVDFSSDDPSARPVIYDPCCGAAYHLTTVAYLHGAKIGAIIASDVDPKAVQLAERNLALLSVEGLDRRIGDLAEMREKFGKVSHEAALESARFLRGGIFERDRMHPIPTRVFQADAADGRTLLDHLRDTKADIVFTDVPYGRHSGWRGGLRDSPHPVAAMLDALWHCLAPSSLVAVASDKGQKIFHEKYRRIERFRIGKRQVVILKPKG